MIHHHVQIQSAAGQLAPLADHLARLLQDSRQQPGCVHASGVRGAGDCWLLDLRWQDEQALLDWSAQLAAPCFGQLMRLGLVRLVEISDGHGLACAA